MRTIVEYLINNHIQCEKSTLEAAGFLYPTIIGINTSIDYYSCIIDWGKIQRKVKQHNNYYTKIYDRANSIQGWSEDLTSQSFWLVKDNSQKADYAYCALYPLYPGNRIEAYEWVTGYSINKWAKEKKNTNT